VTDHTALLQEHSQLYHHLSLFESEAKRKLAMEMRRIDMLSPLLQQLNKASYEVLHKQVPPPPLLSPLSPPLLLPPSSL
jgi:hypothetical protein